MKTFLTLFGTLAVFSAAAENILLNGSFERPIVPVNEYMSATETNVPGWTGLAWVFGGFNYETIWPNAGSKGRQYGNFGNSTSYLIKQNFTVPHGGKIQEISWWDATSTVLISGTYEVKLVLTNDQSIIANQVYAVGTPNGARPFWQKEILPLPSPRPGSGHYRIEFSAVDTQGWDYLIDDVVVDVSFGSSTIDPNSANAYAANAGWMSFRPNSTNGVIVNGRFLSGWAFSANAGWLHFGDGSPANGNLYLNQSLDDYGVNRDSVGNFSGFAYSANIGWINFGWAGANDPNRPHMDLITGKFSGYAYSANVGWINLETLRQDTVTFPDSDLDELPDAWEITHFGNLSSAGRETDYDEDGSSDLTEFTNSTDPRNPDSPVPSNPSTISASGKFAYGANIAWLNFRPSARWGVVVQERFLSGGIFSPNIGWLTLGSGAPGNGHAYSNISSNDFGVNLGSGGNLSGYGYSANAGWFNFEWAGANDPNRPRLSLSNGEMLGYAYGANIGWLHLGSGNLSSSDISRPDTDADSMSDAWEMQHFNSIFIAGIGTDVDGDGQSDASEYVAGTNPNNAADWFRILNQNFQPGILKVTLEFTSSPDRLYHIEHSSDLGSGGWTDSFGAFTPDSGTSTVRSFSVPAQSAQFFRLGAVLPLVP